jgi:hypothetical protein
MGVSIAIAAPALADGGNERLARLSVAGRHGRRIVCTPGASAMRARTLGICATVVSALCGFATAQQVGPAPVRVSAQENSVLAGTVLAQPPAPAPVPARPVLAAEIPQATATAPQMSAQCGCPEADQCCDDGCCIACRPCPCAYAYVDGLILERDNQAAGRPLVLNLDTEEVLLNMDDIDFDFDGGVRAVVGWRPCGWCRSIELVYWGLFDQSASALVADSGFLRLPDNLGAQVNNFFFASEVAVRYDSQIHNFEVNLPCCTSCCDCPSSCWERSTFVGFRFLSLEEEFNIFATDFDEGSTDYNIRTENHLYGLQLGAQLRRCTGNWSWEAIGRAGIYYNDAERIVAPLMDYPDYEFRPGYSDSVGRVAFIGDLNFNAIYHLNETWGLRAGYNLVWIDGVALAPDQLDFENLDEPRFVSSGGVFLHGANFGLEARW